MCGTCVEEAFLRRQLFHCSAAYVPYLMRRLTSAEVEEESLVGLTIEAVLRV